MFSSNDTQSQLNNYPNSPYRNPLDIGNQNPNETQLNNIPSRHNPTELNTSNSLNHGGNPCDNSFENNDYNSVEQGNARDNPSNSLHNDNFETTLDELYHYFSNMIVNQYDRGLKKKENIKSRAILFNQLKERDTDTLDKERNLGEEQLKMSSNVKESDVIDLNIGGTHEISTTRSTGIKYKNSGLGMLFLDHGSGPVMNGKVFLDRDGAPFINGIHYLRTGKFPFFETKEEQAQFYTELNFWNIPFTYQENNLDIVMPNTDNAITENLFDSFHFDSDWGGVSLKIDENNGKISKKTKEPGLALCKENFTIYSTRIDLKVYIASINSQNKSHLFIGGVERSQYNSEKGRLKLGNDTPSAYFWDVWNNQLIKTDDKGNQTSKVKGYGCQCQNYETIGGIEYDYKSRDLKFYKSNMCLGVAFRNVPNGGTPAVYVLFEEGFVEIVKDSEERRGLNESNYYYR